MMAFITVARFSSEIQFRQNLYIFIAIALTSIIQHNFCIMIFDVSISRKNSYKSSKIKILLILSSNHFSSSWT